MKTEYVPLSHEICHHYFNNGGCTFCFFKNCKFVSKDKIGLDAMFEDFDSFADKNLDAILKHDRIDMAPNGSWFPQIPVELRYHIYDFVEKKKIGILSYELRATMFNLDKAYKELEIMCSKRYSDKGTAQKKLEKNLEDIKRGMNEVKEGHVVYFGLEVANNEDLNTLNKGCSLEDYESASEEVINKGGKVGVNILIAPPCIENPVKKVFESVKYAANVLNVEEIYLFACIPGKGTKAYNEWKKGSWNPVSATAASEVYRITKEKYPDIRVKYNSMRVFNFHGRYGKFKRKVRPWSDEEKTRERKKVRNVAEHIF